MAEFVSEASQVNNMLGTANLLLLADVALLAWHLFHAEKPASKPASSEYRFKPYDGNPEVALDKKTGNLCATIPPPQPTGELVLKKSLVMVGGQRQLLPICSQLE